MTEKSDVMFGEEEEFEAFDASEESGGLPGLFVLVAGVLVLLTFSAVVWVAYQQGLRQGGREAPPLIVADPSPIKTPVQTAASDEGEPRREVFDRLVEDAPERTEQLAAAPEEPVRRDPPSSAVAQPIRTSATPAADQTPQDEPAARPQPETRVQPQAPEEETGSGDAPPQNGRGLVQVPPPPGRSAGASSQPQDAPTRSQGVAGATRASVSAPVSGNPEVAVGSHVVQIAAFRSEQEALTAWGGMQRRHGDLLAQLGPDIQRADLGDRGVYYRLRVGPFYEKGSADGFCTDLKARNQDCLVKAR